MLEKISKLWENCCFNYSLYSHHEIGNFRGWHHPSLKISSWSSQASPRNSKGKMKNKIAKGNELGFKKMAAILSPLGLYVGNQKTKLPLKPNIRIHAPEGHFGNLHCSTIGRMPKDRTPLSLDASLAIPTRVLHFETHQCPATPNRSDWFHQLVRPVLAWQPHRVFSLGFVAQPSNLVVFCWISANPANLM
jgi:hypothetical protein